MKPILLVGPPRCGSTWASEVLGAAPGAVRVHEPDSDPHEPFALLAKAGRGRYPVLGATDRAERYERLWDAALTPGSAAAPRWRNLTGRAVLRSTDLPTRNAILFDQPTPRSRATLAALNRVAGPTSPPEPESALVVKSVHSPLAIEFLVARWDVQVVVVRRNPLNAVSSWLELGWLPQQLGRSRDEADLLGERLGTPPPSADSPLDEQQAWSYTAMTRALDEASARHPEFVVVQHEDLCRDPQAQFRALFDRLGLGWDARVEEHLRRNDAPASGYTTQRLAAEQPDRWRLRLTEDQIARIRRIADSLGVSPA